jgi:acyl-CoA synthetase (NDP forming)
VVGASEQLGMSNNAVLPMLEAGTDVLMVNPNRDTVYDRPAHASLSDVGAVDAVLCLVNASRTVDLVAEAASLGCGGVVCAASGFAELGDEGRALQDALSAAAGSGLALMGPNCSGFKNVPEGVNLFTGGRMSLVAGAVAVISQSGFLVRSALSAAKERQLGISLAISSGNEAVCGLADYIEALAADDATQVICLVIEKIRDADAFFSAIAAAHAAGKAVLAVKLGRSARARDIMRSHTGAIADESWVYDLVLRETGVLVANHIDDMLDMAQLLAQIPASKWRPVEGAAVVASSGGVASLAADTAEELGVSLPRPTDHEAWLLETIPGADSLNPLDMTGFVVRDEVLLEKLFSGFIADSAIDALVLVWWTGEEDAGWGSLLLGPLAKAAEGAKIPVIVSTLEATSPGSWTVPMRIENLSFCRGLRSSFRAISAMSLASQPPERIAPLAPLHGERPVTGLVETAEGTFASFATAMGLLEDVGIPVAAWAVLEEGDDEPADLDRLGQSLVVKLADVAHRTELGAVRLGVAPDEVGDAVRELRQIASAHGVSGTVAIQAMTAGHGEAFIGIQGRTDLGPLVLLGRGGVLVELNSQVEGRRLPISAAGAADLVDAVAGEEAFASLRGQHRWDAAALEDVLVKVDRLWSRVGGWVESIDLNPLIVTEAGVIAVDALLMAAPPEDS